MLIAELAETCPRCDTRLSQRLKQPPWCGSCQWNLETYEPDRELPFGIRQLSRVSHRAGYRLDAALFAQGVGAPAGRPGWSPARVLMIGLPLWGSLSEPERAALLAHEFGHFVNNDPTRSLLTQPAVTVFGELAEAFSPHPLIAAQADQSLELLNRIVYVALKPILWVLSRLLLALHAGMLSFAMRDSHRAEYLADDIARRVAGTQATVGLLEALLVGPSTLDALRGIERSPGMDKRSWREAANAVRAEHVATMPLLRQFSLRDEASLFAGHPPGGYRVRMIESRPELEPAVVLHDQDAAAIDKELVRWYPRAGRDIAE